MLESSRSPPGYPSNLPTRLPIVHERLVSSTSSRGWKLWCDDVRHEELSVTFGLPCAISGGGDVPPGLTCKTISMINEWLGQESHDQKWGSRERATGVETVKRCVASSGRCTVTRCRGQRSLTVRGERRATFQNRSTNPSASVPIELLLSHESEQMSEVKMRLATEFLK